MRNLGGAIGLAAINTALTHRVDLHLLRLSETLTVARGAAVGMLEGLSARLTPMLDGGADRAALKLLSQMARREAMTMAFGDVLLLMGAVFALGLLLLPLLQPVRHPSAGSDGH